MRKKVIFILTCTVFVLGFVLSGTFSKPISINDTFLEMNIEAAASAEPVDDSIKAWNGTEISVLEDGAYLMHCDDCGFAMLKDVGTTCYCHNSQPDINPPVGL